MQHVIIVPGVGGSEKNHWQTWLRHQLPSSSRVEQQDWNRPVLNEWVEQLTQHIVALKKSRLIIVAHSFGCLTTLAALAQHAELTSLIEQIILVAPANPNRFTLTGLATHQTEVTPNLTAQFQHIRSDVPSTLMYSENDPWLSAVDAVDYGSLWGADLINLGEVGHVNVASGFGAWPELLRYLCNPVKTDHVHLTQSSTHTVDVKKIELEQTNVNNLNSLKRHLYA